MTTSEPARFTGEIPEFYERHLVPVIFDPYARDLAARVPDAPGMRLLEIACGTGVLTRRILERVPLDARLVATDLNPAMMEIAQHRAGADSRVEWRQADGTQLPFEDASFDVVACQFGVMFYPDKAAGMREARRVLRPGGRLLFNVWDRMELNPFARIANATITGFYPEDPPKFYLTPFGMGDAAELRRLLEAAGFTGITVEGVDRTASSETAASFAAGLVRGNPVSAEIAARGGAGVLEVEAALAAALAAEGGSAPYRGPMRAQVVSGAA